MLDPYSIVILLNRFGSDHVLNRVSMTDETRRKIIYDSKKVSFWKLKWIVLNNQIYRTIAFNVQNQ